MALDDTRHPEAERLGEYADDLLNGGLRAEVEQHLADCAECRAAVLETTEFLHSTNATADPATKVVPFLSRRRLTGIVAGLAAAAALVLAVRAAQPEWFFGPRDGRPELQELIAAVANEPTRLAEGRLSGGFKYAPPPVPTRGAGEANVATRVRIAAAKLEQEARERSTPRTRAALGVGQPGIWLDERQQAHHLSLAERFVVTSDRAFVHGFSRWWRRDCDADADSGFRRLLAKQR